METENQHKSMSCIASDETRARKSNRRGSSAAQKKKPQRGMGVAQLERLRLQQTQFQYHHYSNNHFPFPEPIPSVPVMHGAGHHCVPSVAAGGGGLMAVDQGLLYQRHGNGGGFGGGGGGGCGSGHVLMDPYRVGCSLSVAETSKELTSIPKLQQQQQWAVVPPRCDFCFKKKRFNGDNIGFNGGKGKYAELSSVSSNGYDIPELKQENNINFNGGIKSFGARAATSAFYAGHHTLNEGVEVVAVHRNGNSSKGRNNVLMEYEFFPAAGKGGRSTSSKELGLPADAEAEASVAVVGSEASYFTTCAYNNNNAKASNSVDLSLKLSY
ncbi:hypothetical protein ACOSQ2_030956 [Xanthoceras sorbifolium]|uniref:Uncharacterized protein n=1 Tax=Xanthoceras sorbifolium TaxID=99658 RepID=A0ABQ8H207_9ROSI|nr:hypothetical protein JRO89_XS15G0133900 [Xanthoceras sorbifolium]